MKIVPFFVFIIMDFDNLVEKFNNGDLDVVRYFNDYNTFFSILERRGLMSEIDPKNASDSEIWQNDYLLWIYEIDGKKFLDEIVKLLDNDLIMDENGNIFLEISDRGDLASLFCSNYRNDLSRETIEAILSGDGEYYESYSNTTDNVFRDVIEELTSENDRRLQEYIVNMLKDSQISTESEELELIASEQGHPEYATITSENVKRIIDDEESMNYLFENGLEDLKLELYSIHSSAYNSAYEEEVYDSIFSKIQEYFDGNGQFTSIPHAYKKDTMKEIFKIPVGSNFEDIILDYLHNNKSGGTTLQYWGSYLSLLGDYRDCLSVYPPDYPDSRKVDKNINEFFRDYI